MLNFILWVLLLAALLFWPMSKLIWVLSVRRLQRKLARALDEKEIAGQITRARLISVFVSLLFSFLYNASTIGLPGSG
ncbi:MAG: hypothetical protein KAR22_03130 [Gammaproteobacteria bacterium]|nr:hypothetical protein [Gammaproteobacteria bacterium]